MERFAWQLRNFSGGMHSEPARAGEGSERFAREVTGLRADGEGHLRPRAAIQQLGDTHRHAVTGVAAAQEYLLYLIADGTLWIRFKATPEHHQEIQFQTPIDGSLASPMRGRISIVGDYADFAIVKGTGGSPFWIDMRQGADTYLYAYRLGLEPPTFYPSAQFKDVGETHSVLRPGMFLFYRWTYVRAFGADKFKIRDGEYYREGELFSYVESNPSPAWGFVRAGIPRLRDVVDGDGNEVTTISSVSQPNDAIDFLKFLHSDDPQVTGIMLYQSEEVPAVGGDAVPRINVESLTYRRVSYIPKGETTYTSGQPATPAAWPDNVRMRTDNDVLPETERIYLYNDRIFCPTPEGLRFSDIDGTELRLWAYPEVHAISRAGVKDLVSHRGVLLFGGPTDFHSLAGTSPYDFVVNRLGSVGPVSSHAMHVLQDSVAFVGAAGFYATDGAAVQKLSGALDAEFEDYHVTGGHCHLLPDDTWLFVIQQAQSVGRPRQLVYHFDNGWFRWSQIGFRQMVRWDTGKVRVMVADESRALRELQWNLTSIEADEDAADVNDLIDWSWESERLNFGDERLKQFRELQIEGQALSVVPQREARWGLTRGAETLRRAYAWRLGNQVFALGDSLWGSASTAARVRLTVWLDDERPRYEVFEMRREDVRPLRIPLNRKGKAIRFRLEGRGHLHLKALTLIGAR